MSLYLLHPKRKIFETHMIKSQFYVTATKFYNSPPPPPLPKDNQWSSTDIFYIESLIFFTSKLPSK